MTRKLKKLFLGFSVLTFIFVLIGCNGRHKHYDVPVCVDKFDDAVVELQLFHILQAIHEYEKDNNLKRLCSPMGSDFILKMLVEKHYIISKQLVRDVDNLSESRIDYIYLNPKEEDEILPGTIMITEKNFFKGRKDIYAITANGSDVHIEHVTCQPSELLGKDVYNDFGIHIGGLDFYEKNP
jgi:hypothetical protein